MPADLRKMSRWLSLFKVATAICAAIALYGLLAPESMARTAHQISRQVLDSLDWFILSSVAGFLVVALWLALSRHGKIRLGDPDSHPEFSTFSWLSMLFAAGMGAGLLFWGVAEPMSHYSHPPIGDAATPAAARQALLLTNFHWGLHAWGIYCIGALVLAYFGFCRKANYLAGTPIRQVFRGPWVAPVGWLADLVAIFAVCFGVAASLGLGVKQVISGLQIVAGVNPTGPLILGTLVLLVVLAMISATTGLDRGIKWLSNTNMLVAMLLLGFVLLAGPTGSLMRCFFTALGDYFTGVPSLTLGLYPYQDVGGWFQSWTLSFLVWWIAWAPFVGIFVARISKGRTIREFVLGVIFLPTIFSILWFAVFGGTGLHDQLHGSGQLARLVREDVAVALFSLFHQLPLARLLEITAILLVIIFLVTSVDSATFVLGMLTSGGSLDPPRAHKLTWGTMLGLLTAPITLLGRVRVFQAVMVTGVLPYSLILLLQAGALLRAVGTDTSGAPRALSGAGAEEVSG